MVGSPPAMDTMGAPESSTALRHCSSVSVLSRTGRYSRMRPQPKPVQVARLKRFEHRHERKAFAAAYELLPEDMGEGLAHPNSSGRLARTSLSGWYTGRASSAVSMTARSGGASMTTIATLSHRNIHPFRAASRDASRLAKPIISQQAELVKSPNLQ